MSLRSPVMNVMVGAARKAARALQRDFGELENLQVSRKGPADFVSAADLKAEKTLREELARARPGYGFLMEESGVSEGTDKSHRWIVDPIDGTTNFLHGIPHFAISMALEREGELVAGLIYNPITDEMYQAERGKGAYLSTRSGPERRLRVSARSALSECLIATGIPFLGLPGHERFGREMRAVMAQVAGIRRFGSAALDLAYVAAGRYDGYWEHGLNAWDIAAGILLVREAGGRVRELHGDDVLETGNVLAVNEHLEKPLLDILKSTWTAGD